MLQFYRTLVRPRLEYSVKFWLLPNRKGCFGEDASKNVAWIREYYVKEEVWIVFTGASEADRSL